MKHRKRASVCVLVCLAALRAQAQTTATPEVPKILTLEAAEELLMQRSQAVAASRYQLEVNQALRQIAGYKPNPTAHIGAEQVPFFSPVSGSAPRLFATNADAGANPVYTAMVTRTIERGGKRELRSQQADAVVEQSRAQIADTFRGQLFQLRQAFTTALLARENLKLAQTIDAQYEQTEKLTNIRLKAGDVPEVELFRARAARLPYKQAVLDAQTGYQQAIRDILNLLNARTGEVEVDGKFQSKPVTSSLEELRQLALKERPDVAAALNAVRAAEKGSALAVAQKTRDISLGVEYQRVGQDHSAGVVAEFPLFVYNDQKAAATQAVAQQRAAEAQLRQAETQVLTDVEKAYQAYLAAQKALTIYSEDGLATTEKVRSILEFSYQKGEASLFELLDAQRTAGQSAVAANQAKAAYALAIWQLEQAIGRQLP